MTFDTEQEAISWVRDNTPFLIRNKKNSLVNPFTSGLAFDMVTEHLGKELFKAMQPGIIIPHVPKAERANIDIE